MKRRLFNVLAAVSLVLFVATLAVWLRSFQHAEGFTWDRENGRHEYTIELMWGNGGLMLSYRRLDVLTPSNTEPITSLKFAKWPWWPEWGFPIVDIKTSFGNPLLVQWWLRIRFFPLLLIYALMLTLWRLVSKLRQSRTPATIVCRRCGYDLRATPERCPECGMVQKELVESRY